MKKLDVTTKFKKQLPRNAIVTAMSFAGNCLVVAWLTPYLLKYLGNSAYGLVPLAGLFTQYVTVITSQLSGAIRRFLIIEANKPDGNPNIIFNSALAMYLVLIVAQAPLLLAVIYYLDFFFTIPEEIYADAQILFFCNGISFFITLIGSVFAVSIYSDNRLDLISQIRLSSILSRMAVIVLLFSVFSPKLRYIGYADLFSSLLIFVSNIYFWRKITPCQHLNLKLVDIKILFPIFNMSLWTLVNRTGSLLYLRTDIWIVNKFISPVAAGQYAAILVVSNFLRQLGIQMNAQFGPTIYNYVAVNGLVPLKRFLQLAIKMMSVLLVVPIGVICMNAPKILSIWLGKDYASLAPVLWITIIHLFINAGIFPIFNLEIATKNVKLPSLVTFIMGIANVVLVYLLGVTFGLGLCGVALGGAVILSLKNMLFTPIYAARILKVHDMTFLKQLSSSFLVLIIVILVGLLPLEFLKIENDIYSILISMVLISASSFAFIWCFVVTKSEKDMIMEMIPTRFAKVVKK
ncbi:MAG: lipopolysaccharide biosynthesis protein [Anaerohalosphaeraceae bacterium]|nr:lipopolysaccharide biosynthesis protein [Anaerohalosphaeraceae bacterium]